MAKCEDLTRSTPDLSIFSVIDPLLKSTCFRKPLSAAVSWAHEGQCGPSHQDLMVITLEVR